MVAVIRNWLLDIVRQALAESEFITSIETGSSRDAILKASIEFNEETLPKTRMSGVRAVPRYPQEPESFEQEQEQALQATAAYWDKNPKDVA